MSIFGSIVDKIVHYAGSVLDPSAQAASPTAAASTVPASTTSTGDPAPSSPPTPDAGTVSPANASPQAAAPLQAVDIGAVLGKLNEEKGGALNWQTSIVDLLKVLDLDSSLSARKTLAQELDVHAGAAGSAEENEALHAAVVAKLEENGGTFPASIKG